MARSYSEVLQRLYALEVRGVRLELDRVRAALALRGHPECAVPFVHVAGTNGKGSVASSLASTLRAAGHRTGLFTSPHLHRFVERVRVDGRPLGEVEAARRLEDLLDTFAQPGAPALTFFEVTFLLALEVFRDRQCDIAVLEIGLGGRFDATNAAPSILSVITQVALDHTQMLGSTTAAIAREKAGILRKGVPAVLGVRDPAGARVIRDRLRRLGAPGYWLGRDFFAVAGPRDRLSVRWGDVEVPYLRLRLPGAHQRENAAIAVVAALSLHAQGYAVPIDKIRTGLARVRWPARLETVPGEPYVLFDAAHNPDGCAALCTYLDGLARESDGRRGKRVLVFGAMADKDYPPMLRALAERVDGVVYLRANMARAVSIPSLQDEYPGEAARDALQALRKASRTVGKHGLVIVAGSIFVVAAVRAAKLGLATDPPIRA